MWSDAAKWLLLRPQAHLRVSGLRGHALDQPSAGCCESYVKVLSQFLNFESRAAACCEYTPGEESVAL